MQYSPRKNSFSSCLSVFDEIGVSTFLSTTTRSCIVLSCFLGKTVAYQQNTLFIPLITKQRFIDAKNITGVPNVSLNKNAFQQDAYRSLFTVRGWGSLSRRSLCLGGLGGGLCPGEGSLSEYPPPMNGMTHRCKNITLPQTSFAAGKNSSNKMLPPVRIEYGTFDSKSNSFLSELTLHVLVRRRFQDPYIVMPY